MDVLTEPTRSLADGILMTPTLMVLWPIRKIVGALIQPPRVLQVLGPRAAAA